MSGSYALWIIYSMIQCVYNLFSKWLPYTSCTYIVNATYTAHAVTVNDVLVETTSHCLRLSTSRFLLYSRDVAETGLRSKYLVAKSTRYDIERTSRHNLTVSYV